MASAGMMLSILLCHTVFLSILIDDDRKYSRRTTVLVWSLLFVFFYVFAMMPQNVDDIQRLFSGLFAVAVPTYFGMYLILSKGFLAKRCFCFATYFTTYMIIDTISTLITRAVLESNGIFDKPFTVIQMLISSAIRFLLYMVLIFSYQKYVRKYLSHWPIQSARSWWSLTIVSLVFCALLSVLTAVSSNAWFYDKDSIILFIFLTILFITVNSVIFSSITYISNMEQASLIEQNAIYLKEQVENLHIIEEDARRIRHDLHHHNLVIAQYAKAGDNEGLLSYLHHYAQDAEGHIIKRFCENDTVNNILIAYDGLTQHGNIRYEVKADVISTCKIRDVDFVAILANLLENALNGSRESEAEDPFIEIILKTKWDKLVIICRNSCHRSIKISGGLPKGKSIGIASICSAAERYNGEWNFNAVDGIFEAMVLLAPQN